MNMHEENQKRIKKRIKKRKKKREVLKYKNFEGIFYIKLYSFWQGERKRWRCIYTLQIKINQKIL